MATTATATRGVRAALAEPPAAAHGLAALALKLQHPLVRIRARALANLLFKLRERLVDLGAEPLAAVDALMQQLVASLCEPELEQTALQVLQLVLLDTSTQSDAATRVCAEALRRHGAAAEFQRGGLARNGDTSGSHAVPDSQATYEALLHRLLATSSAVHEEWAAPSPERTTLRMEERRAASTPPPTPSLASSLASSRGAPVVVRSAEAPSSTASALVAAQRAAAANDTSSDPLTRQGWHFPRVALAAVDEQFLFEFEVKWRLRTSVPEIVEMCDSFRRELLRDFPPEVFLQRPSILLRVLELVRQPIVPAATTPELSFGVNYFDEPASRGSFVWKPSVLATALHVSTLKAIESWLAALRHAMEISMNPMYHTFRSSTEASSSALMIPTTGYDDRRLYYPRVASEDDAVDREEPGMSLGGAAYLALATLMRLLPSESYPHLHLLNVIHVVTELLPERSVPTRGSGANPLDKMRLEALFAIVVDVVCVSDHDRDALVNGRIVEWFAVVLRLVQPAVFRVEGRSTDEDLESSLGIVISNVLWDWILRQLALSEGGDGCQKMTQLLDHIDSSASSTIAQLSRSNEDRRMLTALLGDDSHPATIALAEQVLRAVPTLSETQRSGAVRIVLQAVCTALMPSDGESSENDAINGVLIQTISLVHAEPAPVIEAFAAAFYNGFVDWVLEDPSPSTPTSRLKAILRTISDEYLYRLLCRLASNQAAETTTGALWRFTELIVQGFEQSFTRSDRDIETFAFSKSLAIMQHLAYVDPTASAVNEVHRRLQRSFMALAHQAEASLSDQNQLLAVARCLVHRTAFIRRAAASGLLDRLEHFGVDHSRRVERGDVVSVDPFGQFADGKGQSPRRVLEQEFPSILQPHVRSEYSIRQDHASAINGGSILHRISRLRKLLSSLSMSDDDEASTQSAVKSTLHQLLIDLVHSNSIDFTILEEAGEVEELIYAMVRLLPGNEEDESRWHDNLRAPSLSIVRVLLMRSDVWRQLIRRDMQVLGFLLSFVFDQDARVRAEMYFIVMALACSLETPSSKKSSPGLVVPSEFSATFGLFSERWSTSGISVLRFIDADQHDPTPNDRNLYLSLNESAPATMTIDQAVQRVWDNMLHAKSFRTFLDALYALLQACYATHDVRTKICARWGDAPFRRYLETPPTSSKDLVIMAAIIAMLNVLFDTMSADEQMDIILLLRHKVIPLQLSTTHDSLKTSSLQAEVARLLLRISRSASGDMLVPLLVDTGLLKNLGSLVVASGVSTGPALSQRALWIEVAISALDRTKMQPEHPSTRQQILDAVRLPLHAFAGRHHVPGSFQERDAYVCAVSCLIRSNDDDAPWRARLLFETLSNLRSTGFRVAASILSTNEPETTGRILRLATDTMNEATESDAVRSSAAELLLDFYQRVERESLPLFRSYVDWDRFVPDLIRDLISLARARDRCTVRLNYSRIQLLRFFISQPKRFAGTPLGNVLVDLIPDIREDSRALMAVLELLSVRRSFESYRHYGVEYLHMQPAEDGVWLCTILPIVLNTVSEVSKLILAIAQHPSSSKSIRLEATSIIFQLTETIADIASSLNSPSTTEAGEAERHYDSLDQCGKLLAVVLSTTTTTTLPQEAGRRLVQGVASLLDPAHPRLFRLSFARVVPAILCVQSGELFTETRAATNAVPMGQNLWAAYIELCNLQPLDPAVAHRRTSSFLPHLRRIACSLHILLSQSEDASSSVCEGHQGAVKRVVQVIRNSFAAARMAGGFGTKSLKRSDDDFVAEICDAIQLHCQVLSGLFVKSRRAQTLAREEVLPLVLANNWRTMHIAHQRGSRLLVSALRLLQNFIHASDENKTSLATTVAATAVTRALPAGGGDSERSLLVMIGELTLGVSAPASFDERWSSVAGTILKSAFLHIECLHSAIKTGLVAKLFASVVERCKRQRQTVKTPSAQEERTLIELVGVLASVASSDEGRQIVLQTRELKDLLDDIFHFAEGSQLSVAGALFVRNMAFSKFSKSHFSVWEPVLDEVLALLLRTGEDGRHVQEARLVAAEHFSTALLCLVHDNQRAQSVLQSSRKALVLLRDATRAWGRIDQGPPSDDGHRANTVMRNLECVTTLVTGDQGARTEIEGP